MKRERVVKESNDMSARNNQLFVDRWTRDNQQLWTSKLCLVRLVLRGALLGPSKCQAELGRPRIAIMCLELTRCRTWQVQSLAVMMNWVGPMVYTNSTRRACTTRPGS
jgi:hypothetical protein